MKNANEIAEKFIEKYPALRIEIVENKKEIILNTFFLPEYIRNEGIGTKILEEVIKYSNVENKTICLNPSTPEGEEKIDKEKLSAFFVSKHGFQLNTGKDRKNDITHLLYKPAPRPYPEIKRKLYQTIVNNQKTSLIGDFNFDKIFNLIEKNKRNSDSIEEFLEKTNIPEIMGGVISKEYTSKNPNKNEYDEITVVERFGSLANLRKIGEGSDRIVYDIGNGMSLKVAKNSRGLTQNTNEFGAGGDMEHFLEKKLLPKMYEWGEDYIISEMATPYKSLSTEDKKRVNAKLKPFKEFSQAEWERKTMPLQDAFNEAGYSSLMDYDLLLGDFVSPRNWGVDSSGNVIMLDGGTIGNPNFLRESQTKITRNYKFYESELKTVLSQMWNTTKRQRKARTASR